MGTDAYHCDLGRRDSKLQWANGVTEYVAVFPTLEPVYCRILHLAFRMARLLKLLARRAALLVRSYSSFHGWTCFALPRFEPLFERSITLMVVSWAIVAR